MKKIIYIAFIIISNLSNYSIAQQQDLWTTFTIADGLADNKVNVIIESSDGALWFGTDKGVSRYYEGEWTTFTTANGLVHDHIFTILESRDGALWFGTFNGVSRYYDEKWTTFSSANGLTDNWISSIIESRNSALWFGSPRGGVSCFYEEKWMKFTSANGLVDDRVQAIIESSDEALWFGTKEGVSRYYNGAWTTFSTSDGLVNNWVNAIVETSDGALWFGTNGGGVSRYNNGIWTTFTMADGLDGNYIFTIYESSDGALWFGTTGGGGAISRYYEESWTTLTPADGLVNNTVITIHESSDGALWFGTWNGVNRYYAGIWINFTSADGLAGNRIEEIIETSDGALWFGSGGVSCLDDGKWYTFTIADGLIHNSVRTILESNDGALWFGTCLGVSRYYEGTWTTYTEADGLSDNMVFAIIQSSDGALWFGTFNGVSRYYAGTWITFTIEDGLGSNDVYTILESNDGALWFGTCLGVSRYYEGTWTTYTEADGLADNWVHEILESKNGTFWYGTDRGVSHYYEGTWATFTTVNGLAHNSIYAILESSDGALWFGTNGGGVSRYYKESWITFTPSDGLVNNFVFSIHESSDGLLWFGTNEGVSRFKPDRIPPFTFFIEAPNKITGTSTPLFIFTGKDYRTKQDELYFSFTVVDTSIIPEENRWSFFSKATATQTQPLQNGTYTFYVKARDQWGNVDPTPATKTFTVDITPPTLVINSPKQEQHIKGKYPIIGSAFDNSPIRDFNFYKLYYGYYISETQEPEWKEDRFINLKSNEVKNDTLAIFNTLGLEDGLYQLKLWAIDTLKHTGEDKVTITIDNTLPEVQITYAKPIESLKNTVQIRASIVDINIDEYVLEYKFNRHNNWRFLHRDTLAHSIQDSLIFSWENISDSGNVSLKLTGWDKSGNFSIDSVQFLWNNLITPYVEIISPTHYDTISSKIDIYGTIADVNLERCLLEYKMEYDTLWQYLHQDTLIKSIENKLIYSWENKNDSGDVCLKLTAWDKDNNSTSDKVQFVLYNMITPQVQILAPGENEKIRYNIDIIVTVYDNNIDRFMLEYKMEYDTLWQYLHQETLNEPIEDRIIYSWQNISDSGYVALKLTAWDKHDNSASDTVQFLFDNSITPQVKIAYPKENEYLSQKIDIKATILDLNLDRYLLEHKMPFHTEWQFLHQDTLNKSIENELIYTWHNTSDSGDVHLKLTVWDKDGNFALSSVKFLLDNKDYQLPTATIIYPPDNAYLNNWRSIKGNATDKDFTKYSLYLKSDNIDTLLVESYEKKENEELFTFDTRSFPDGVYNLLLTVWNNKEYKKTDKISITIDNTPPSAKMTAPLIDTLKCFVQIYGEVNDDNLKGMTLNYAKYGVTDTSKFSLIDTFFTCWNTMELNGLYTLYLSAEDKGGLKTIDQRSYYIDNQLSNERTGLKKTQDEVSLYIPPNGYNSSVICIKKLSKDSFDFNVDRINPTDLIFEIHSSSNEKSFKKPGVLTVNCSNLDLNNYDESSLSIFCLEDNKWQFIGGTFDDVDKTITAAINQVGTYGVFESKQIETFAAKDFQLTCQPRVFSPRGGGYNNETIISFYLNKTSTVTIKIFNTSGRLICTLLEDELMNVGNNVAHWDGKDNDGNYCVSGLYVVVIRVGEKVLNKTVMILNN